MAVIVRTFPHDDLAFRAEVQERLAPVAGEPRAAILVAIQACLGSLRESYPRIRVHVADALALSDPTDVVVYVYRDGTPLSLPREGPGAMRRVSPAAMALLDAASTVTRSHDLRVVSAVTAETAATSRARGRRSARERRAAPG